MDGYGGEKINFVQVGLGTNSTFIQNLVGEKEGKTYKPKPARATEPRSEPCDMVSPLSTDSDSAIWSLLQLCSETDPSEITGISIEPVPALINKFEEYMSKLPNCRLLQAALSDSDRDDVEVNSFTLDTYNQLMEQVEPEKRQALSDQMLYLINMSCVGQDHPAMHIHLETLRNKFNMDAKIQQTKTNVWTWSKLVEAYNFKGCEVLLVDTEGYDAAILRSLIRHCQEHPDEWPDMIEFESMGLCDKREGIGTEKSVKLELEKHGYIIICHSEWNTYLIHMSVIHGRTVKKWLGKWWCALCRQYNAPTPYTSDTKGAYCSSCTHSLSTLQRHATRHLKQCANPECDLPANPDPAVCLDYCCEKCEGRAKGEKWAFQYRGWRRHTAWCPKKVLDLDVKKCANPDCDLPANPDTDISDGYCCERCEGRAKGWWWALRAERQHTAYCTCTHAMFVDLREFNEHSTIALKPHEIEREKREKEKREARDRERATLTPCEDPKVMRRPASASSVAARASVAKARAGSWINGPVGGCFLCGGDHYQDQCPNPSAASAADARGWYGNSGNSGTLGSSKEVKKPMKAVERTMTKSKIAAALALQSGLSSKQCARVMDSLASLAAAEVKTRGSFVLPGICTLKTRPKPGAKPGTKPGAKLASKRGAKAGKLPAVSKKRKDKTRGITVEAILVAALEAQIV